MKKSKKKAPPGKIVCTNKKAYHEYHIDETFEAGIMLVGPEVKSLRAGKANLKEGYAKVKDGEIWLHGVHISPYSHATQSPPDPHRIRKVLLNKREIKKLIGKVNEKGIALVPLKIYFKANGKAKLELALARGKKLYDKRTAIKERDSQRELDRYNKGNRYN